MTKLETTSSTQPNASWRSWYPATTAAADIGRLGDSRRRRRIGRGEPPGEATYRVDKADFDDYVLPKLSDNSELSDSEDEEAPMAAKRGRQSHSHADVTGVAGLRWQTDSFA